MEINNVTWMACSDIWEIGHCLMLIKRLIAFSSKPFRQQSTLFRKKFSTEFTDNDAQYERIVHESGVCLRLPTGSAFRGGSTADRVSVGASQLEGQNVFVIHPKVRWGANSAPSNTTPELMLEEAVALIRTLPGFNVATSVLVGTDYNTKKKLIWGGGRLEALMQHKLKHSVTAIMVNVDMLTPIQQTELTAYFGVPVYDRYNIVLLIFKLYAKTREAHLQIALAEIPYIRHRLKFLDHDSDATPDALHVDQAVTSLSHGKADKYEILRLREHSLRKKLKAVMEAKQDELESRGEKGAHATTVVAVIGYTNAGKTTLVKKLTGAKHIFGEDRLFATLDTTVHSALLPSGCRVVFADTIGFISSLPVTLFASFQATLKHVVNADLLIHIQDLSHPNVNAQRDNVIETLHELGVRKDLIENMLTVGNKIDKLDGGEVCLDDVIEKHGDKDQLQLISCENGFGLDGLIEQIDQKVQSMTGARLRRLKLRPDSPALAYLYRHGFISPHSPPTPSDCEKFLIVDVLMNDDQFAKFRTHMPRKLKAKRVDS
uniref:Hflx-type G domain-containing protein n=1 Tax=Panagrellus redivivus TaxID=6233 RepID=A0A7E4VI14_PANRE